MLERPTRRSVLAVGATAALVSPVLAAAQTTPEEAEKELAKPLTDQTRRLLKGALAANARASKQRLGHRLPEGSEPSFTFAPSPREVRRR